MSGIFKTALSNFRPASYSSSSGQRHSQRVQAATELLGSGLQKLDVKAVLPAKFAQILIALFSIFRTDTHGSEKGVQFMQFALAATQLALIITLFAEDNNCEDESNALCKSKLIVDLFFEGLLAFSFALAEISKESTPTPSPSPNNQSTEAEDNAPKDSGNVSIIVDNQEKLKPTLTINQDEESPTEELEKRRDFTA